MTCFSCEWYRGTLCARYKTGFPEVGTQCRDFSYEPGSDEKKLPLSKLDQVARDNVGTNAELAIRDKGT